MLAPLMTSIVLTSQNPQCAANPLEQWSTDVSQDKEANSRPIRVTPNVTTPNTVKIWGNQMQPRHSDPLSVRHTGAKGPLCFVEGNGNFLLCDS